MIAQRIEGLERRRLLAATLADGLLLITGEADAPNVIEAGVSGGDPSKFEVTINGSESEFNTADAQVVRIVGGSLGDSLTMDDSTAIRHFIRGGAGDDTITGGGGRADLRGDTGNDTITANGLRNQVFGNDGDDVIFGESQGRNFIVAGDGADTVTGGDFRDIIFGAGGADSIDGGNGSDKIHGGRGNDTLNGGDGDDVLLGFVGNDLLSGGNGNDKLFGMVGADTLLGSDGDDTMWGGQGADSVDGGSGNSVIRQREAPNINVVLDEVNTSTI